MTNAEAVLPRAAIAEGEVHRLSVGGEPVALFLVDGQFYAIADRCSHEEARLSEGDFDPACLQIECPVHGSRFDIRTGQVLTLPATEAVAVFDVLVQGSEVRVSRRSEAIDAG